MSQDNEQIVFFSPDSEQFRDVLRLRYEMLNKPYGMAEQIEPTPADRNPRAMHLGLIDEQGGLEGTLRVVPSDNAYLLERLAAAHPGSGVGRKLVETAEQIARDNGAMRLETNAATDAAIAFFTHLGFHAIATETSSANNRNMVKDL